ncbi:hypothetical protein CSKR_105909 [Clonorchis sinensis]|uniref:Uncharacterized protein n=1 Tax=Clonorchis sinensis TaxID=79923 RepID=A0A419QHC6_CLOSI|nr:hypothetical protein CSKR_105909 [Clonorchis sinensis]
MDDAISIIPVAVNGLAAQTERNRPDVALSWEYNNPCTASNFKVTVYKNDGTNLYSEIYTDKRIVVNNLPKCVAAFAEVIAQNVAGDGPASKTDEFTILTGITSSVHFRNSQGGSNTRSASRHEFPHCPCDSLNVDKVGFHRYTHLHTNSLLVAVVGFCGIDILFIFTQLSFERPFSCSGVLIPSTSAVHIQWPCRDLNPGYLTCEASVLPLLHQRTLDASEFSRLNRRMCSHLSDVIVCSLWKCDGILNHTKGKHWTRVSLLLELISSAYPVAVPEFEPRTSDMRGERVTTTPPTHVGRI